MQNTNERNYFIDIVKASTIILVVLGHLLESFQSPIGDVLYKFIYFFHMPLLIFISGYLNKFNHKKMLKQLIIPLCVFQILYVLAEFVLFNKIYLAWDRPIWILWYLLSLYFFKIISHYLLKWIPEKHHKYIFIFSIVFGLMFGFVPINYTLSISRTIVFFPFFILGSLVRNNVINFPVISKTTKFFLPVLTVSICALAIAFGVSNQNLFGSYNYSNYVTDFLFRIIIYLVAFLIIYLIFSNENNCNIKFLTIIARHSMSVYLLHGFIILIIRKFALLQNNNISVIYSVILSIVLTYLLVGVSLCYKNIKDKIFIKNV